MKKNAVESYLSELLDREVEVTELKVLGEQVEEEVVKDYGYGTPVRVDYLVQGESRSAVIETVSPGDFGHQYMADRAKSLLLKHASYGNLPRHVRALDIGGFDSDSQLVSAGRFSEFFLLVEFVEGRPYAQDLARLRDGGEIQNLDIERARSLSKYFSKIHAVRKKDSDSLYSRRIRELLGHSECIMGLCDSYPENHPIVPSSFLCQTEKKVVDWRWKLKNRSHRLSQIHGDPHPWNILFRENRDFTLLDRSRGPWGEPADDLACLSLNYYFFSLQRNGEFDPDFEKLFLTFWDTYLKETLDREVLEVIQPFFVFRALVMASPVWYPNLDETVREKLVCLIRNLLDTSEFDPQRLIEYGQ